MLLEIRELHAFYGQSHILHGINLQVHAGEIVSVLGRNGAGRSTLLKAIVGQVAAHGQVRFRDEHVLGLKTYEIARRGIAYVPESRDIFTSLSVEQNLQLGEKRGDQRCDRQPRWRRDAVYAMFPQLHKRRHVPAGSLSGGEQQMLALSRSLMGDPDLLLVDEPTEGLSPQMVDAVAQYLTRLRDSGIAILLIEQRRSIARDIAQRLYVMGHGAMVFEGTPQALEANGDIRRQWLEI